MVKKKIIVICGPTASGKTALSVALAKRFGGTIINADSMQIYKGIDIASAKPTAAEREGVPHLLMDFLDPSESFSVADFVRLAAVEIDKTDIPFVVGGTGLYITSLIDNIRFSQTETDYSFRDEMRKFAAENGNNALHEKLAEIDPEAALSLHPNNLARVIRALEVFHTTGEKMSEQQRKSRLSPSPYNPLFIAPSLPREILYTRINKRVDLMLEQGLLDEARWFLSLEKTDTAAQAIGYKELFPYLKGEKSLAECVEHLKQETRNYAKRQMTWFNREKRINWLDISDFDAAVRAGEQLIQQHLEK